MDKGIWQLRGSVSWEQGCFQDDICEKGSTIDTQPKRGKYHYQNRKQMHMEDLNERWRWF
jgi:hypothetical protein